MLIENLVELTNYSSVYQPSKHQNTAKAFWGLISARFKETKEDVLSRRTKKETKVSTRKEIMTSCL